MSSGWSSKRYLALLGLSRKRREDLLRYAMKYYWVLGSRPTEAVRALAAESPSIVVKTLSALTRLAEHLGVEEDWTQRRLLGYRLRGVLPGSWLPRYIREEPGFVEKLLSIAERLPDYRLFAAFMLATGAVGPFLALGLRGLSCSSGAAEAPYSRREWYGMSSAGPARLQGHKLPEGLRRLHRSLSGLDLV